MRVGIGVLLVIAAAFAFTFYAHKLDPPEPRCQEAAAKLGGRGVYVRDTHQCWVTYENQRPVKLW